MNMGNFNKEDFFLKYGLTSHDIENCGISWEELERIYADYSDKYERGHWDKVVNAFTADFERYIGESIHFIRARIKAPERVLVKLIRLGLKAHLEGTILKVTEENYPDFLDDIIGLRLIYLLNIDWIKIHNEIIKNYKRKLLSTPVAYVREEELKQMEVFYKEHKCTVEVDTWGHNFIKYRILYGGLDRDWKVELQVKNIFEEAWWEIGSTIWYSRRDYSNIIDNQLGILKSLSVQCSNVAAYSIFLRDKLESQFNKIRQQQEKVDLLQAQRAETEFGDLKESSPDEIRHLLELSKTEIAISKLDILIRKYQTHSDYASWLNEKTLLSERFNRTRTQINLGVLSYESSDKIYNQITDSILTLIKKIE